MEPSQNEWLEIEERFRAVAVRWLQCQLEQMQNLSEHRKLYEKYYRLAKAASTHVSFSQEWRRALPGSLEGAEFAEDLREISRTFRKPARLIDSALTWSRAEIRAFRSYPFKIKTRGDLLAYEEWLDPRLPVNKGLVIDHAAYALYVAWRPESRIFVPDNRLSLLRAISLDESTYRIITPRQFEELVAYVYECLGCRVELTQQSRDFGADILAWQTGPIDTEFLIAVQVKHYAAHRKVGLKGIFELHGAVTHYHAHTGHVVTSSDFSKPARDFASVNRYSLVNLCRLHEEIQALFRGT